jgi:hypothetical protein
MFVDGLGRDLYKYDESSGWMTGLMEPIVPELLTRVNYVDLLGHDPLFVEDMYASRRAGAYKIASPVTVVSEAPLPPDDQGAMNRRPYPYSTVDTHREMQLRLMRLRYVANPDDPEAEFRELFGVLDDYDSYYINLNEEVTNSFYKHTIYPFHPLFGELFLENLLVVNTFVTQAALDLVIFSPAIPASAREFDQVSGVTVAADSFTIAYTPGSFDGVGDGVTRTVSWPPYETAGHSVTVSQPDKFAADVAAWYGALHQ